MVTIAFSISRIGVWGGLVKACRETATLGGGAGSVLAAESSVRGVIMGVSYRNH